MATIECTAGPTSQDVGGTIYDFIPDQFGRYVATVWVPRHIAVFMGVPDHYRLVNADNEDPYEGRPDQPEAPDEPAVLDSIEPATAARGSADFTLHCIGSGFTAESVIYFNNGPEPIIFVSENEVTTVVKPSLVSAAVTVPVRVDDSDSIDFTFTEVVLDDLAVDTDPPPPDEDYEGDQSLTAITGIGDSIANKLFEAGVHDVRALARLSKKDMAALDEDLGFGGRSARDDWVGQAKKLAR